jgi:hypothetical protein
MKGASLEWAASKQCRKREYNKTELSIEFKVKKDR